QAEDGIRDRTVTGVQMCALPISPIPADMADQVDGDIITGCLERFLSTRRDVKRTGRELESAHPRDPSAKNAARRSSRNREVCVPWYSVIDLYEIGAHRLQRLHSLSRLSRVANGNRVLRVRRFGTIDQRAGGDNLRSEHLPRRCLFPPSKYNP